MSDDGGAGEAIALRRRVWVTLAFVMLGTFLAQIVVVVGLLALGYEIADLQGGLPELGATGLLAMLVVTQALSYLAPGILAARSLFKGAWLRELSLVPAPTLSRALIGVAVFAATLAFTAYLAQLNASLDLAEWQAEIEGDIAAVLAEIITGTSPAAFALVLLAVAVLPALGEEIVFRGLIQPGFIRMTGSAHFGIWLTAGFFGLVHLQFAGLLPRVFLGAVLGFLAYRSQRLWIPIVAHALFNGAQAVAARMGALEVVAEEGAKANATPELLWGLASAALAGAGLHYGLPYLHPDGEADGQAPLPDDSRP